MDYIRIASAAQRWWWLIVAAAIVGGVVAYFASSRSEPTYRATATLLVIQQDTPGIIDFGDLQTSERLASTLVRLVEIRTNLEAAIVLGGFDITPEQIDRAVFVFNPPNTNILEISARSRDPILARDLANAMADAFVMSEEAADAFTSGGVRIVERALTPRRAVDDSTRLVAAGFGVILAVMLAIMVVVAFERIDNRVRVPADAVSAASLDIIGTIHRYRSSGDGAPLLAEPGSRASEDFRALRAALLSRKGEGERKSLLVLSPTEGDGKTSIVANLAVVIGLTGRVVVTVDADLRSPALHRVLDVENDAGLSSVLLASSDSVEQLTDRAVRETAHPNVSVLPAGPAVPNPSELLGSPRMERLLEHLHQTYDFVIVDSAPLVPVSDAMALAQYVPTTIIVVRPNHTRQRELSIAVSDLRHTGNDALGLVLTHSSRTDFVSPPAAAAYRPAEL